MTTTSCKTAVPLDVHPELNINNQKNIEDKNQSQPAIEDLVIEQASQSVVETLPIKQELQLAVKDSQIEQAPHSSIEVLPIEQESQPTDEALQMEQEPQPADEALSIEQQTQQKQDLTQILDLNENEEQIQDCLEFTPAISTFGYFQESSRPFRHPSHILMAIIPLLLVMSTQFLGNFTHSQTSSSTFEYDTADDSETSSESDFSSERETRASTNADNSSASEIPENDLESFLTDHEGESDHPSDDDSGTRASTEVDEISIIQSKSGESTPTFLSEMDD